MQTAKPKAVPSDFLRKSVEFMSLEPSKCWGLGWNLTLNGSVWALKWCKSSV
jgi:hypothetical protein